MAMFRCKMCGGGLEFVEGQTVCECQYCGMMQTLPKLTDDKRRNLYDRANHFRRNNDFDKAMGIYEQILNEDGTDAEAYWSLVLCRYGIEYVEDPATRKRMPTVNRAQFTSVFDDEDYKAALNYADKYQKRLYEEEADAINEIQRGILEISQKEEPFDVFICYKETDEGGRRTQDSVLANDLYHQLTQEGFKVFFSRITLEDKIGTAYEPYIFAALNSARVMVVLGTRQEYFNAVWVKNEWSRYLALVKQSNGKKMLIPAYRDMDPYDLPEEFSHLQAQDMGKLGFMQDLIRGIKKLLHTDEPQPAVVKESVAIQMPSNIAPLLKRVFMFLEDGDFTSADEYCEKVLDIEPECAEAYLGKLMVELRVLRQEELKKCAKPFDTSNFYKKAYRFGSEELRQKLSDDIAYITERIQNEKYNRATNKMRQAIKEKDYELAAEMFEEILQFKDSEALARECHEKAKIARKEALERAEAERRAAQERAEAERRAEQARKEAERRAAQERAEAERKDGILNKGLSFIRQDKIPMLLKAIEILGEIPGWKNADELIEQCRDRISELEEKEKQREIDNKDKILADGLSLKEKDTIASLENALTLFADIPGWRNADALAGECNVRLRELKEERERQEAEERRLEALRKKKKKLAALAAAFVGILIGAGIVYARYYFSPRAIFKYSLTAGAVEITGIKDEKRAVKDGILEFPKEIQGERVVKIGKISFQQGTEVHTVVLPLSLESLSDGCFSELSSLKKVVFDGTAMEWDKVSKPEKWLSNPEGCVIEHIGDCLFGEWKPEESFICTKGGTEIRVCGCGKFETREVAPTNHTIAVKEAKKETCTESGCTQGKYCSVCNKVLVEQQEIPATGHTVVEDEEVPAKCGMDGTTAGTHCEVCGETLSGREVITAAPEHSFGEWEVTKKATCMEEGERARRCSKCGEEETKRMIGFANHVYSAKDRCTICGFPKSSEGLMFVFDNENNNYIVEAGLWTGTHLIIPETYHGYPVTMIKSSAFSGYDLTKIELPKTLTHIGGAAFENCAKLSVIYYDGTVQQWKKLISHSGRFSYSSSQKYATKTVKVQCSNGVCEVTVSYQK